MSEPLQAYLKAHPPYCQFTERWPVQGELKVSLSLASILPPVEVASSVLSIVLNSNGQVLSVWPPNPDGNIAHMVIGGRAEGTETPPETAIREVGEETGWRIEPVRMIGFRHFFHLEPRSDKTDRPYPDFIQPIFAVRAIAFDPALLIANDLLPVKFLDFAAAEEVTAPAQRLLLRVAADALK